MPRLRTPARTFGPEALSVLGSALDGAWKSLMSAGQLNGDAEAVRTELAKQVIRLATQGERDRQRLIQGALVGFRRRGTALARSGLNISNFTSPFSRSRISPLAESSFRRSSRSKNPA